MIFMIYQAASRTYDLEYPFLRIFTTCFINLFTGLNSLLKLKTKSSPRTQSLSWSESVTSLSSQMNTSAATSQLSLLSCSEDSSTTSGGSSSSGSSSATSGNNLHNLVKSPKPVSVMLSDVPYEPPNDPDSSECFEEPDFVPMDMSQGKGCEIITDPEMIRKIEEESALRIKFRSVKSVPFNERWFTTKNRTEVEHLLHNSYHVDGYFLVTPEFRDSSVSLYLNVMFNDVLHHFKIYQVSIFFRNILNIINSFK